jgi:CRISPR-associated protein Cmr2
MSTTKPEYWRRKLNAFLHDSPDKVISLLDHDDRARSLAQAEGFDPSETARKESDHAASAADRLPWPKSKFGTEVLCRSEFDATDKAFKDPLGQSDLRFETDFKTALQGLDIAHATKPRLVIQDDPRATFIAVWRFWQNWASAKDERFAFLPAETRLPDHTIWNHLSVASAMQGCCGGSQKEWIEARSLQEDAPLPDRPAFLLFSLGPVQDFIAAARNTRDLWSGSYLLSYLVGSALTRIALDFGPDHVIFPNLLNQPILDLLLRGELWDHHKAASGRDLWQAFDYYSKEGKRRLLTPSLPNRFLALLPATMAEHAEWQGPDADGRTGAACYAEHLADSVRNLLNQVAGRVADHLEPLGKEFNRDRFLDQARRLLEIHWQVLEWPNTVADAQTIARQLPGEGKERPDAALRGIRAMIRQMPKDHRDPRYFAGKNVGSQDQPGQLKQVAAAWSALVAGTSWRHDAVKTTRAFKAWATGGWHSGLDRNKDSLTGREEACLAVPAGEKDAAVCSRKVASDNPHALKAGDRLGAPTLLKRFWHLAWLAKEHTFEPNDFAMPNTRSVAAHKPWDNNADDEDGAEDDTKYFAILALDGDEMGKWISGVKCPELAGQLSDEAAAYFRNHANAEFLGVRRPLSPSFHLQFSELLGNFSLHCARRIVEAFDGRLIYAGGDDVLAMLPADTALECARALRAAFRGEKGLRELAKGVVQRRGKPAEWKSDRETRLFEVQHEGFVKLTEAASPDGFGAEASLLSDPVTFAIAVPGPAADASVGIAIAHFKSPLQDVVRAAQDAEKRAKKQLGRSAVAVTLFKRSGETIEWGAKWERGGLELYRALADALQADQLSSKFPYRVVELLEPYLTQQTGLARTIPAPGFKAAVDEIIQREFAVACGRQRGPAWTSGVAEQLSSLLVQYVAGLGEAEKKIRDVIGLCQTVGFANRTALEDKT